LSKNHNCFVPTSHVYEIQIPFHIFLHRYPDEEVGQIPMAFVVRKNGSKNLTEDQIMEFVAKQVHTTPTDVVLNFLITLCIALTIIVHLC
jgi:hypothetical protein